MKQPGSWKRNVGFFLGGQALSLFGSMLVQYAIMWYITLTMQSGMAMMLYVLVGLLPTFFTSPFGGVWADRYDRKRLIILSDGGIAAVSLAVALVLLGGYKEMWLIFVCAALRAFGQGIHSPAESAFIPQITPKEHLAKVNGLNASIQSAAMIAAPAVSGLLLSLMPLEIIFFVDVVTAAVGIGILYFCVRNTDESAALQPAEQGAGTSYFRDIKEGLRYMGQHPFIGRMMLIALLFHIAISPTAFLTPLQVARDFGDDVWRLTAIEILFSGGMMMGGLVVGWWGGFRNKMHSMALAYVLMGLGAVMLGVLTDFRWYLATMLIAGLTMPLFNIPFTVLFQTQVDAAYLGRVFGVFGMISSLVMPAGMLLFGPMADLVSIDLLLIITGVMIVALAIPFISSKTLREAGRSDSISSHP